MHPKIAPHCHPLPLSVGMSLLQWGYGYGKGGETLVLAVCYLWLCPSRLERFKAREFCCLEKGSCHGVEEGPGREQRQPLRSGMAPSQQEGKPSPVTARNWIFPATSDLGRGLHLQMRSQPLIIPWFPSDLDMAKPVPTSYPWKLWDNTHVLF